jgi:hypothetical protein
MAELTRKRHYFAMGCLLGILHHQRPGFLSYPASHLVPYLRDRLYPPDEYPEAYKYRNPIPRLQAKIERVLKSPPPANDVRFRVLQKSAVTKYLPDASVDAVITSPPYMDALDYARDNRLRLWFLGIENYRIIAKKEISHVSSFRSDMLRTLSIFSKVIRPGGACVFILGDVKRRHKRRDASQMVIDLVGSELTDFTLEARWSETIPNRRRTRRSGRATLTETIVVLRCNGGGIHG